MTVSSLRRVVGLAVPVAVLDSQVAEEGQYLRAMPVN